MSIQIKKMYFLLLLFFFAYGKDYSVDILQISKPDSSTIRLNIGFKCNDEIWSDSIPFLMISNNDTILKTYVSNSNTKVCFQQKIVDSVSFVIILDPNKNYFDSNYDNNMVSRTFTLKNTELPDYFVRWSSKSYNNDSVFSVYYTLMNIGGDSTNKDTLNYNVKLNGMLTKNGLITGKNEIQIPLTVHDSVIVEINLDPDNKISETLKNNNITTDVYHRRYYVSPKNEGIDCQSGLGTLTFYDMYEYTVSFSIRNVNLPEGDTVQIYRYINGDQEILKCTRDQTLSYYYNKSFTFGCHEFIQIADPYNKVQDINRTNNYQRLLLVTSKGTTYHLSNNVNKRNLKRNVNNYNSNTLEFNLAGRLYNSNPNCRSNNIVVIKNSIEEAMVDRNTNRKILIK